MLVKLKNEIREYKTRIIALAVLALLIMAYSGLIVAPKSSEAAINKYLNYQGKLLDASELTVTDSDFKIRFRIYGQAVGGGDIWDDTFDVTTKSGLFSVLLGSSSTLDLDFETESGYWISVEVNGDGEMTPRKEVGAAAYSFNTNLMDGLEKTQIGSTTAAIVALGSNGNLILTGDPQGGAVTQGSLYINPAVADVAANDTIFGIAVAGTEKLRFDEDGDLHLSGYASMTDLFVQHDGDSTYINIEGSGSRTLSGAYLVGVEPTNITQSASTNVQFVLEDISSTLASVSTSANLWSLGSDYIYPASTTADVYLATTQNMGIGTSSPTSTLQVSGGDVHFQETGGAIGTYWDESTGRLGIGLTNPSAKLEITQISDGALTFRAGGEAGTGNLNIYSETDVGGNYNAQDDGYVLSVGTRSGGPDWKSAEFRGQVIMAVAGGSVGIGTASPTSTLQVSGGDVHFQAAGGADGMFWDESASQLSVPAGSAASPSYTFDDDLNTGFYQGGADTFGITAGGHWIAGMIYSAGATQRMTLQGRTGVTGTSVNNDILRLENESSNHKVSNSIDTSNGNYYIEAWESGVDYNNNIILNSLGGNVGVGTTSPGYKFTVTGTSGFEGRLAVSSTDLVFDAAGTALASSTSRLLSGAYFVGVNPTNIGQSTSTNVQFVLEDMSSVLGAVSSSANLWTDAGAYVYPTDTANDMAVGYDNEVFYIDVGLQRVGIGTNSPSAPLTVSGTAVIQNIYSNSQLDIKAKNDSHSYIRFADTDDSNIGRIDYDHGDDSMSFYTSDTEQLRIDEWGRVGIGDTSPNAELVIASASGSTLKLGSSETNQDIAGIIEFAENTNGVWGTSAYGYRINHNGDDNRIYFEMANGTITDQIMSMNRSLFVGIGDDDADAMLDIASSTASMLFRVDDSGDGDSSPFVITGDGYVGIATSTPEVALHVIGTFRQQSSAVGGGELTISTNGTGSLIQETNNGLITSKAWEFSWIDHLDNSIFRTYNTSDIVKFDYNVFVAQSLYVSSTDLVFDAAGTALASSTSRLLSGAYFVGVSPTNIGQSTSTNVQFVLEDMSTVLTAVSTTVASGSGGLWTDSGLFTYLTATGDDLVVGASASATADLWLDVSDQTMYLGGGAAATIATQSDDNLVLLPNGTGITVIGDAGATSRGLTANDDLFVSGKLEVDGFILADDTTYFYSAPRVMDNINFDFGTGIDASIRYSTVQTQDTLLLGLSADSNGMVIIENADVATDFGHALQTNPTIFLHSADEGDTSQWLSFSHNQTDAVLNAGAGNITIGWGADTHGLTSGSDLFIKNNLEVDGTSYFDGNIFAFEMLAVSSTDLVFDAAGTALASSTSRLLSGAYFVGVNPTNIGQSNSTNVQFVLEDISSVLTAVSTTVASGSGGLWTDSGLFTYLTATGDDLVVGASTSATADLWLDVSDQIMYLGGGGAATIATQSNDNLILLPNGTGVTVIGDLGASVYLPAANDNLFVSGAMEVATSAYFRGTTQIYGSLRIHDNVLLNFGGSDEAGMGYNTTQTPDTLMMYPSAESNAIVIAEKADLAFDFAHAQQTNPTLFIHSASQTTDMWISLSHNQTNALLQSGSGTIQILPASTGGHITQIGDAGTTSRGLAANDDLFVSGKLEVDGTAYFDGRLYANEHIQMDGAGGRIYLNSGGLTSFNANGDIPITPHGDGAIILGKTGGTGYTRTGWGSTSHSMASSSDLFVDGKLEVDGTSFFDGNIFAFNMLAVSSTDLVFDAAGTAIASSTDRLHSGAYYVGVSPTNIGQSNSTNVQFVLEDISSTLESVSTSATIWSTGASYIYPTSTTADVYLATTQRLGIGTTTPESELEINSSGNQIKLTGSSVQIYFNETDVAGDDFTLELAGGLFKIAETGVATRMLIDGAGDFNFNSGDVYFANSTGNVGIGTVSPTSTLQVSGGDVHFQKTGGAIGTYWDESTGELGIGTTSPDGLLHLVKDSTYNVESSGALKITDATSIDTGAVIGADAANNIFFIQSLDPGTSYGTRPLVFNPNGGSVGIGTISPTSTLQVSGGDVHFQANGGAPGLYWDESSARLGIGITAPTEKVHIYTTGDGQALKLETNQTYSDLIFMDTGTTNEGSVPRVRGVGDELVLIANGIEGLRLNTGGNISVWNELHVSSSQLIIGDGPGGTALYDNTGRLDSGAYFVGVNPDNIGQSTSTNVQFVLEDISSVLGDVSSSATLWTEGVSFIYPTSTTSDLIVGSSAVATAALYVDVSANTMYLGGGATGTISTVSNDNLLLLPNGTGITIIGDAGTTSHSLNTNDDLFVSGILEVDGIAHFDSDINLANNKVLYSDSPATKGGFLPRSSYQTNDSPMLLVGTDSRSMIMVDAADRTTDYTHGVQENPTLFIHSSSSAAVATDEWISFTHNGTNGIIDVGAGGSSQIQLEDTLIMNNNSHIQVTGSGKIYAGTGGITTYGGNENLKIVPNGTGYTLIGDAGATSHGFNTNDDLFVSGRLEVDGTSYFDGNIFVFNMLAVSSTDLVFDAAGTAIASSTDRLHSGAYYVGVSPTNIGQSNSTNVQFVLEDISSVLETVSTSATIWSTGASYIYPSSTTAEVYFAAGNYVGIGTTAPSDSLTVAGGNIVVGDGSATSTITSAYADVSSATDGYKIAGNIVLRNPYTRNIFVGQGAGTNVDSGGTDNTYLGYNAGSTATSTDYNTGIGSYALQSNTIGNNNTAVGYYALQSNTTGNYNSALGVFALRYNTAGINNSAVGYYALQSNTSGNNNTSFGYSALRNNTVGDNNAAFGVLALEDSTTGNYNTAFGVSALRYNKSATSTTAVGYQAGYGVDGVSHNQNGVFIGYQAGVGLTTGDNNTFIGYQAGNSVTTGQGNILLGYDVDTPAVDTSNFLNIGNTIYGDLSNDYVGIGTTTPGYNLHIAGTGGVTGAFAVSSTDLVFDAAGTAIASSTDRLHSGAYYVGVSPTNIGQSNSTNVQFVLEDISGVLTTVSSSANLWSLGASYIYPTSTTAEVYFAAGNYVGIGTSSPTSTLQVSGGDVHFMAAGGAKGMYWDESEGQLSAPGGSQLAPGYSFSTALTSGLYTTDINGFGIAATGAKVGTFYNGYARWSGDTFFSPSSEIAWTPGVPEAGAPDIGLSRLDIGKLGVGNGTALDFTGTLIAGNIGIGTDSPGYNLHIAGTGGITGAFAVSSTDLVFDAAGTAIASSTDRLHSGAYYVGVSPTNIGQSNSTNVQFVLEDISSVLETVSTSATIWSTGASYIYPSSTTAEVYFAAGNYVGIGTSSPTSTLQVSGGDVHFQKTGGAIGTYWDESTGRLGISTTTPSVELEVNGAVILSNGDDHDLTISQEGVNVWSNSLILNDGTSELWIRNYAGFNFRDHTAGTEPFKIEDAADTDSLTIQTDGDVIMNAGNVGIGTASPTSTLQVSGGDVHFQANGGAPGTYWDESAGFLGIGITDPTSKLHVSSTNWNLNEPLVSIVNRDPQAAQSHALFVQGGADGAAGKILEIQDYSGITHFLINGDGESFAFTNFAVSSTELIFDAAGSSLNTNTTRLTSGAYFVGVNPDQIGQSNSTNVQFVLEDISSTLESVSSSAGIWANGASYIYPTSTTAEVYFAAGNYVGIGTSSPTSTLQVSGGDVHFQASGGAVGAYWDESEGRLGVGTTTPSEQIEITGNLKLPDTTALTGIIKFGSDSVIHNYGTDNTFVGKSGNLTLTGTQNSGFGDFTMQNLTAGAGNSAFGAYALTAITSGYNNIAVGRGAIQFMQTGDYNTAIGYQALRQANSADSNYNVAIGYQAGYSVLNTSPTNNVFLGAQAGYSATDATDDNIFIGYQAGYFETSANKLYIENSSSTLPLIYGEFDNNLVAINGSLYVSATDLVIGFSTRLASSTSRLLSGAYFVGVSPTNIGQSNSTNVQFVLEDISGVLEDVSSSLDIGARWTDRGAYIDPNNATGAFKIADTTGYLAIGSTATTTANWGLGVRTPLSAASGNQGGVSSTILYTGTATGDYNATAGSFQSEWNGAADNANTQYLFSVYGNSLVSGVSAGSLDNVYGVYGRSQVAAGNVSTTYGVYGKAEKSGGLVDTSYAGYFNASGASINYGVRGQSSGAATVNYGVYAEGTGATTNFGIQAYASGGTTAYGVFASADSAATNYAFYSGDGAGYSYFGDHVAIEDAAFSDDWALGVMETYSDGAATGGQGGVSTTATFTGTVGGDYNLAAGSFQSEWNGTANNTFDQYLFSVYGNSLVSGVSGGSLDNVYGVYGRAQVTAGNVSTTFGVYGKSQHTGGNIDTGYAGYFDATGASINYGVRGQSNGSATVNLGVYAEAKDATINFGIQAFGEGGTIAYGVYAEAATAATNYAFYSPNGGGYSYFGDHVAIEDATPTDDTALGVAETYGVAADGAVHSGVSTTVIFTTGTPAGTYNLYGQKGIVYYRGGAGSGNEYIKGVYGQSVIESSTGDSLTASHGLYGYSLINGGNVTSTYGVQGTSRVLSGMADTGYGGYFESTDADSTNYGIRTLGQGGGTQYGGYLRALGSTGDTSYGVYSIANGTTTVNYGGYLEGSGATTNYGVRAQGSGGTIAYGVYASAETAATNWAFYSPNGGGNVQFGDNLYVLDFTSTTDLYVGHDADGTYIDIEASASRLLSGAYLIGVDSTNIGQSNSTNVQFVLEDISGVLEDVSSSVDADARWTDGGTWIYPTDGGDYGGTGMRVWDDGAISMDAGLRVDGHAGFGDAASSSDFVISIMETYADLAAVGAQGGTSTTIRFDGSTAGTYYLAGDGTDVRWNGDAGIGTQISFAVSGQATVEDVDSGSLDQVRAIFGQAQVLGGNVSTTYGVFGSSDHLGGNVDDFYGGYFKGKGGNINGYGIYALAEDGSNQVGGWLEGVGGAGDSTYGAYTKATGAGLNIGTYAEASGGTSNYAFYSPDAGGYSYFGDHVAIEDAPVSDDFALNILETYSGGAAAGYQGGVSSTYVFTGTVAGSYYPAAGGFKSIWKGTAGAADTEIMMGVGGQAFVTTTGGNSMYEIRGAFGQAKVSGTGYVSSTFGVYGLSDHSGGYVTDSYGGYFESNGADENSYGVYGIAEDGSNQVGGWLQATGGAGDLTYGAYVKATGGGINTGVHSEVSGGVNNYAFWAETGGATSDLTFYSPNNKGDAAFLDNLLVGALVEGIKNPGFATSGDDLFVSGMAGIEGNVYTNGSFIASSTMELGDSGAYGFVSSSLNIAIQPNYISDDYIYFMTEVAGQSAQILWAGYTAGNDPGFRINTANNELEYRDEDELTWTAFDSFGLASDILWTDRGAYIDPDNATGNFQIKDADGYTAIGPSATLTDDFILAIGENFANPAAGGIQGGVSTTAKFSATSAGASYLFAGIGTEARWAGTADTANDFLIGVSGQAIVESTGGETLEDVRGLYAKAQVTGGLASSTYGIYAQSDHSGGLVDDAYGGYFKATGANSINYGLKAVADDGSTQAAGWFAATGGAGDDTYGIWAEADSGDNNIAVYADADGGISTSYAFYTPNDGDNYSYFGDHVAIEDASSTDVDWALGVMETYSSYSTSHYIQGAVSSTAAFTSNATNAYFLVGNRATAIWAGTAGASVQVAAGIYGESIVTTSDPEVATGVYGTISDPGGSLARGIGVYGESTGGTNSIGIYGSGSGGSYNYAFYSDNGGGYSHFGDHVSIEDASTTNASIALGVMETFTADSGATGVHYAGVSSTAIWAGGANSSVVVQSGAVNTGIWNGAAGVGIDQVYGTYSTARKVGGGTPLTTIASYSYGHLESGTSGRVVGSWNVAEADSGTTATYGVTGVYGEASGGALQHAGYFDATGDSGDTTYGIYGHATGGDTLVGVNGETDGGGTAYGLRGRVDNSGTFGYGVRAEVSTSNGTAYGTYGWASGSNTTSYGAYGYADGATTNYGVTGEADDAAVKGINTVNTQMVAELNKRVTGATPYNYGLYVYEDDTAEGTAYTFGVASYLNKNSVQYAGYFETEGVGGHAVYAEATGSAGNTATNYAVQAVANGGVYTPSSLSYAGFFQNTTVASTTYAIYADADNGTDNTYAFYTPNDGDNYSYFGDHVGIEDALPDDTSTLYISETHTGTSDSAAYGIRNFFVQDTDDDETLAMHGLYNEMDNWGAAPSEINGVYNDIVYDEYMTTFSTRIYGIRNEIDLASGGGADATFSIYGEYTDIDLTASTDGYSMTTVAGNHIRLYVDGTISDPSNAYGLYIDMESSGTNMSNNYYGIYVRENLGTTTNYYGLYLSGADSDAYIGGANVRVSGGSSSVNNYIYFNGGTTEYIAWDEASDATDISMTGEDMFVISDDLEVADNLYIGGNSAVDDDYAYFDAGNEYIMWDESPGEFRFSDDVRSDGMLYINDDATADSYLYFAAGSEYFWWDEGPADRFVMSDSLYLFFGPTRSTNGVCQSNSGASTWGELYDCSSTPSDIAEWYPIIEGATAGDIVYASSGTVAFTEELFDPESGLSTGSTANYTVSYVDRSATPYDSRIIGIVSTSPVERFGESVKDATSSTAVIALIGRVPTRVSDANGSIKAGDIITSSDTKGIGMKATKPGMVVGTALDDLSGATGTIMVFVNPMWYSGGAIHNDGNTSTLHDNFAFEPSGTATSSTTEVDSFGLTFRGSGWDAASSTELILGMSMRNEVSSTDEFGLGVYNDDDDKVAFISNNGDLMLSGRLYPSDKGTMQDEKYIFLDNNVIGDYMRTNADGWATGSYDYAEMFSSEQSLEAGDIVTVADLNEKVKRSNSAYETSIVGIVSTKPGFIAGEFTTSTYPIALAGRVPTKVTNTNGDIEIGDPITPSDIPGVGMKATQGGPIVGYALEYSNNSMDEIIVYVNPSYYGGGASGYIPGASGGSSGFDPSDPGEVTYLNGTLDMQGHDIYGVNKIYGNGYAWEIDENGVLVSRVDTGESEKPVYGVTTTKAEIIVSGSGVTEAGVATVEFTDEVMNMFDSANLSIKVIVTPTSADTAGLAVVSKSSSGFTVQEINGGTGNVTFDWMFMAPRIGYEQELEDYTINPASAPPEDPPAEDPPAEDPPPEDPTP